MLFRRLSVAVLSAVVMSTTGCITLDQIMLRPSAEFRNVPSDLGYVYEEVTLPVTDDRSMVVWHVMADDPKAVIVFVPGMDQNKGYYLQGLPMWIPNGYSVVLVDYEGFGNSPGTPSLASAMEDGGVVLDYAKTLHDHVFAYSVSFGTPVLAYHAGRKDLAGCIFEGTLILHEVAPLWLTYNGFGVVGEWAGAAAAWWMYPQIPPEYDIAATMPLVDEPKLFLQSVEDTVTPYHAARRIFESAPEPKTFHEMRGDHGEMIKIDFEAYSAAQIGWLDKTLAERIANQQAE